tara:strand:- start:1167 stop:1700 length:534 start_codon:yes stop_codon:yes gene_type:complete
MQNKKVGMMKNTFIQITLCWLIVVFSVMGIGKVIKGEDNKTKEWSTQLLYDTTNACYQGTYRWIVMANPLLIGQQPPPIVQRQMIKHCFCVMDKIRNEFDMEKYVNLIKSGLSVGQLFMDKAYECIDEYETLKGVIIMPDNSTKTDNDSVVIPTEPEGQEESMPDEELEQEQSIFKG